MESKTARARTLIHLGIWGLVAAWSSATTWLGARMAGREADLGDHLLYFVPGCLLWALVTVLLYRLSKRPPPSRRTLAVLAIQLTALGLVWTSIYSVFLAWYDAWFQGWPMESLPEVVAARFSTWAYIDFLVYWCVAAAVYGVSFYLRYQEEARRAARLREELVRGELRALRAQLQPHFLFNTLSSISNLIRVGDRDTALRVVADVGDLLRDVLAADREPWRTLGEELEPIERYLGIQVVRFGDRLRRVVEIDDACRAFVVPRLVLQPLVENAVLHGVATRPAGGTVELRARLLEGNLRIEVVNPAPEADGSEARGEPDGQGTGLANLRQRLAKLYEGRAVLSSRAEAGSGRWRARLDLPPVPEPRISERA